MILFPGRHLMDVLECHQLTPPNNMVELKNPRAVCEKSGWIHGEFPPNFQNNPLENNIPTDGQMTQPFFSGRIYEPARRLYLFFQVVVIIPTDGHRRLDLFFQVVIMNPPKHPSLWNPPNHSHWRPDNWTFFSGSNYEPARQLYLFFFGS